MSHQNGKTVRLSLPAGIVVNALVFAAVAAVLLTSLYHWHINVTGGPLFHAVGDGNTERVLSLLDAGVNPDQSSDLERNRTPLMIAADQGHTDIVRALISHHANVNAKDDHDRCVLDWAEKSANPDQKQITALLKQAGAHR